MWDIDEELQGFWKQGYIFLTESLYFKLGVWNLKDLYILPDSKGLTKPDDFQVHAGRCRYSDFEYQRHWICTCKSANLFHVSLQTLWKWKTKRLEYRMSLIRRSLLLHCHNVRKGLNVWFCRNKTQRSSVWYDNKWRKVGNLHIWESENLQLLKNKNTLTIQQPLLIKIVKIFLTTNPAWHNTVYK